MTKKKDKPGMPKPGTEEYERLKEHLYSKKPLLGADSPFSDLLQGMVDGMLEGEMEDFLWAERESGRQNKRNGKLSKEVISSTGPLHIRTPRDRNSDFEPELIGKRQRELSSGLDEQIMV